MSLLEAKHALPTIPPDLRPLLGEDALTALAREAAARLSSDLSNQLHAPDRTAELENLLGLLTYCYAAGIYASDDIGWSCEHENSFRRFCTVSVPDAEKLRSFRRANRPWIEECLVQLYHQTGHDRGGETELRRFIKRKLQLAALTDMAANE